MKLQKTMLAAALAVSSTFAAANAWQQGYAYQGGEVVNNGNQSYECKAFPYNGWCGLSAYEPGVGFAWTDAWVALGDTTPVVTPTATPTATPTVVPSATPTIAPTATPTAVPTTVPTDVPEFVPGVTKAQNGQVFAYGGSCWEAKNNPGVWETPREGWFWTEVACEVVATPTAQPTQVPTQTPTATPTTVVSPTSEPTVTPVTGARTPVIAYQPSWAFNLNAIQWDKLTHINYSFALPDADGSLTIEQPQNLQALSNAAVGKDVEIWLAIGGWTIGDGGGNDADWSTITQNPQLLERFKGEIQTAIDTYNLDGIDIDWEWPNNNTEKALYLQLMQELDAMLEPQGKGLSTAVISRGFNGQYVDARVFELVDYFNLMAYDDNWPWSGDNKHSDMGVAQASLDYWINQRGAPADKVILGVPFYCRGNNQAISYEQLLANGADPDADAHQGCYYNGRVTMKQKAELAKQRAAGVMFWELSQDVEDDRSLLTVIDSVLNP
ncbi:glycosyl hydrolase family 18 protein [Salinibius halmophilus]|uniref:glycosyl hydrolase family 18 protein n=1 Tax=Salinibius halmophilus TaxID=1853216 RepID=UPI000E66411B|nr:glycosyl hydrolase family 18 protein [Salinibius halmophilus]